MSADLLLDASRVLEAVPRLAQLWVSRGSLTAAVATPAPTAPPSATAPATALPSATPSSAATSSTSTTTSGFDLPTLTLSLIVFLPVVFAFVISLMPDRSLDEKSRIRTVAVFLSGAVAVLLLINIIGQITLGSEGGLIGFGNGTTAAGTPTAPDCLSGASFCEYRTWIPAWAFPLSSFYHLDADGFTLPLLTLSTVIFFGAFMALFKRDTGVKRAVLLMLLLETGVNGVLCTQDYLMLLGFWGLTVIPVYLLIRQGGRSAGDDIARRRAAGRYLGYFLAATASLTLGVLLLVVHAIPVLLSHEAVGLGSVGPTFDMQVNGQIQTGPIAGVGFALMAAAGMIAMGAVPAHRWVIEAVSSAETTVGTVVAIVVTRLGAAVLMRDALTAFPSVMPQSAAIFSFVGAITTLWGAFGALAQRDLRRRLAYIGVAQTGVVLLAIGADTPYSLTGATLMIVASGFSMAILLSLAGALEERTRVRSVAAMGGLANQAPRLAGFWIFAVLSAVGTPLLAGFTAEFMTFMGSYGVHRVATAVTMLGLLVVSGTLLVTVQRIFFGPARETFQRVKDGSQLDYAVLGGPALFIVLYGVLSGQVMTMIYDGVSAFRVGG